MAGGRIEAAVGSFRLHVVFFYDRTGQLRVPRPGFLHGLDKRVDSVLAQGIKNLVCMENKTDILRMYCFAVVFDFPPSPCMYIWKDFRTAGL